MYTVSGVVTTSDEGGLRLAPGLAIRIPVRLARPGSSATATSAPLISKLHLLCRQSSTRSPGRCARLRQWGSLEGLWPVARCKDIHDTIASRNHTHNMNSLHARMQKESRASLTRAYASEGATTTCRSAPHDTQTSLEGKPKHEGPRQDSRQGASMYRRMRGCTRDIASARLHYVQGRGGGKREPRCARAEDSRNAGARSLELRLSGPAPAHSEAERRACAPMWLG